VYQGVFVNGTLLLARLCAAFDKYVIDFLVDGAAKTTTVVAWLNGLFRQLRDRWGGESDRRCHDGRRHALPPTGRRAASMDTCT